MAASSVESRRCHAYGPLTYATALTTAEMLARRQEREASAVFINGVGEEQVRSLTSLQRAILLISRARMLLADGDLNAAHTNLQQADELVRTASDLRLKRLLPDILSVRAAVEQLEAKPDRASASLSEAMAAMGPERTAHRAAALIARAGLFAHVPGRLDASDDVNEAIALLRARVQAPVGQPLRLDEAAPGFSCGCRARQGQPGVAGTARASACGAVARSAGWRTTGRRESRRLCWPAHNRTGQFCSTSSPTTRCSPG